MGELERIARNKGFTHLVLYVAQEILFRCAVWYVCARKIVSRLLLAGTVPLVTLPVLKRDRCGGVLGAKTKSVEQTVSLSSSG